MTTPNDHESTGAANAMQDDERSELARLREFVSEFRSLIDLHDRTPHRWRYFQAEWLWMYARGMIEGSSPAAVKSRRLEELKVKDSAHPEEAPLLHESMNRTIVHFMKAELYGGPADGGNSYLRVPASDDIVVYVPSEGSNVSVEGYRRAAGAVGDILAFEMPKGQRGSLPEQIDDVFAGKKAAKYVWRPVQEAYDAGDGD